MRVKLLRSVGLPIYHPACQPEIFWQRLFQDVLPHKMGHLHLVVLSDIGKGTFIDDIADIDLIMLCRACSELESLDFQFVIESTSLSLPKEFGTRSAPDALSSVQFSECLEKKR